MSLRSTRLRRHWLTVKLTVRLTMRLTSVSVPTVVEMLVDRQSHRIFVMRERELSLGEVSTNTV